MTVACEGMGVDEGGGGRNEDLDGVQMDKGLGVRWVRC